MKFLKGALLASVLFLPALISATNEFDLPPLSQLYPGQCLSYPYEKEFKDAENIGCFRKKFVIPAGQIFSAVAQVSFVGCDLYVNGQLAYNSHENVSYPMRYFTKGVNILPYLTPGENVIGIKGSGYIYFHANIVMASGEKMQIVGDNSWKYAQEGPPDWAGKTFDDSSWQSAKTSRSVLYYSSGRPPAYGGRLVIENPYEEKLFYSDTKDVVFRVRTPEGMAKSGVDLAYSIKLVETGKEKAQGAVNKFEKKEIAAIYDIQAGKLERGVYVLSLALKEGQKVLEERSNEVFIVVGRIPQKKVAGTSLEEGMDLMLEDTINCADAQDKYPYLEGGIGPTKIVENKGLRYREAGPVLGKWGPKKTDKPTKWWGEAGWEKADTSYFAYKVKIKNIDQPYLFVLEYPDDRERNISFQINQMPTDPLKTGESDCWIYQIEGAGAVCGGKYPLSGKIKSLPILCFPPRDEVTLTVNTAERGKPAAASRILVYRVGNIPAFDVHKSGERLIGRYSERGYSFRKMLDGYRRESNHAPVHKAVMERQSIWSEYWQPEYFAMWLRAIERFVQYLNFTGENLYIVGCYQYQENNTPYTPPSLLGGKSSRLEADYREIMARIFSENNIALLAGMEVGSNARFMEDERAQRTDEEVAKGAETIWPVTAKGKQIGGKKYFGLMANLYHPLVQDTVYKLMEEITLKLAPYPAFKGFYFVEWPQWAFTIDPKGGYEDFTINLFEKETGVKIPIAATDPERFEKRDNYLRENLEVAAKYTDWRCYKIKEIEDDMLKKLRAQRKDLMMILRTGTRDVWEDSEGDYNTFMKKMYGKDFSLYRWDEGITLARLAIRNDESGKIAAFKGMSPRITVSYLGHFVENLISNPGERTAEWPWPHILTVSPVAPADEHTGEEFTRIAAESDPQIFVFGWLDDQLFPGHEQVIRNFARGFLPLPGTELKRDENTAIDSNIIVRSGTEREWTLFRGRTIFWVINPGWWPAAVELEISGGKGEIIDLANQKPLPVKSEGKNRIVSVQLPPYGTSSLAVPGWGVKLIRATEKAGGEGQAGMEELLKRTRAALNTQGVQEILPEDEIAFMNKSIEEAQTLTGQGKYVAAWAKLNNRKFMEIMEKKVRNVQHVRPYLLIGPFANNADFIKKEDEGLASSASDDAVDAFSLGFDTVFEVEQDTLAKGAAAREKEYKGIKDAPLRWRPAITENRDEHAFINFLPLFKPQNWTVGYAWTKVYSETDQAARLFTGSDDGMKVWVNGQLVVSALKARGAKWGDDQKEAQLKKGANWVLVKVENRRGGFGFYLDFVGADNKPLGNLKYSTR